MSNMDQIRPAPLPASRAIFLKSTTNGTSSSSPSQSPHHARQQPTSSQPRPSDIATAGNAGPQQATRPTPPPAPQTSMNSTSSAPNSREKTSEASSSSAKAKRSDSNSELRKNDKATKGNEGSAKGLSDGRRPSKNFSKGVEPKTTKADLEPKVDEKQQLIQSFKADLLKLQQIATCKICIKFLYEPYTLTCGHTYCYECICHWFQEKKTCPVCRCKIDTEPAPAYLIKEMIDIFIHRSDLLPPTETSAEHIKWRREAADRLERDKANKNPKTGGLFRGCFRELKQGQRWHRGVLRDEDDGVDRCPDCMWELEGRYCSQCDVTFQEDGRVTGGSHWGRFSDIDDTEDSDGYGFPTDDEIDGDLDFDEPDSSLGFDVYGGEGFPIDVDEEYDDYMGYHTGGVYAIQREIARGSIRPPGRRAAAHSAAGSRRRYSQSIVSDMQTSEDGEMEPLAEESEEEESESMRDFIVDDENEQEQRRGSRSSRSSSQATQEPAQPRRSSQGGHIGSRGRISQPHAGPDDDDDFDEGGAVSNGRRPRARHQFQPPRRLFRRGPIALSTSTETTEENDLDLDEDTEALLNSGYSQLDHDTPEEDMESEQPDDDDDDDDAMTTIGISSTSFASSERARLGGSLTPTADQPNPSIRPPSRTQNGRRTSGNRPRGLRCGLRRVSSSVSATSTVHYEDGEADDDESDIESLVIDIDGDVEMGGSPLRARRDPRSALNIRPGNRRNQASEGTSVGDPIDLDTDVSSDTSVQTHRRRQRQRSRQPEYDPRISMLFAEHQIIMREQNSAGLGLEAMMRGRTPTPLNIPNIPRPRTANRNRGSQSSVAPPSAPPFSPLSTGSVPPFSPISITPGHSRNSSMSSSGIGPQGGSAPFRQSSEVSNNPRAARSSTPSSHPPSLEGNTASQTLTTASRPSGNISATPTSGNASSRPSSQPNSSPVMQQGNSLSPGNAPESPTNRSDSATPGRRGSVQGSETSSSPPQHIYSSQSWGSQTPGFNLHRLTRNPWAASFTTVRPRQSNRTLRGAPSNETIRPSRERGSQNSQTQGREATASPHPMRTQPSLRTLRPTGSRQTLRPQNSINHIRRTAASPSPMLSGVGATVAGPRNVPLSQEEKNRRGREVVQRRAQELMEQQRQQGNALRLGLAGQANQGAGQQQQNQPLSMDVLQYRRSYSAPVSNGLGSSATTNSPLPSFPGTFQSQARGISEAPSPRTTIQRPVSRRAVGSPGMTINSQPYSSPPPNTAPIPRTGAGNQNYGSQLNMTSSSRSNPMMAGGELRRF
ncbi:hypothetical protein FGG08_007300 [Glutinoglossum americanum]|uniref:RING-type domain-containing protein n=1 Tax=Glutinoglossum americanum TaxID=1670608 RepID=A0A9P8KU40_9PEZI|nr:hypothetical protein FGG08_007300 [Glutinoglossum americanum]